MEAVLPKIEKAVFQVRSNPNPRTLHQVCCHVSGPGRAIRRRTSESNGNAPQIHNYHNNKKPLPTYMRSRSTTTVATTVAANAAINSQYGTLITLNSLAQGNTTASAGASDSGSANGGYSSGFAEAGPPSSPPQLSPPRAIMDIDHDSDNSSSNNSNSNNNIIIIHGSSPEESPRTEIRTLQQTVSIRNLSVDGDRGPALNSRQSSELSLLSDDIFQYWQAFVQSRPFMGSARSSVDGSLPMSAGNASASARITGFFHTSSAATGPKNASSRTKTVYQLKCVYCSQLVCLRGMKALLLADSKYELYSTDSPLRQETNGRQS